MRCKRECEKIGKLYFINPQGEGRKSFLSMSYVKVDPLFPERCGGFAEAPYLCLSGDPYLLMSRPRSATIETRVLWEVRPGSFFGGIGRGGTDSTQSSLSRFRLNGKILIINDILYHGGGVVIQQQDQ